MALLSRIACLFVVAGSACAEDFSIQLASPVASGNYQLKRSAFVFRTVGCPDEVKLSDVSATAEGRVDGKRRSVPLKISPGGPANVFGIFREWPAEGVWIVNLAARCSSRSAGALVATDAKGFVRESSTMLDHAATSAEVETSLKGGTQSQKSAPVR